MGWVGFWISAHLIVLLLSSPVLNLSTFLLLPITSSHSHANASDSTFDYWRYINFSFAVTWLDADWLGQAPPILIDRYRKPSKDVSPLYSGILFSFVLVRLRQAQWETCAIYSTSRVTSTPSVATPLTVTSALAGKDITATESAVKRSQKTAQLVGYYFWLYFVCPILEIGQQKVASLYSYSCSYHLLACVLSCLYYNKIMMNEYDDRDFTACISGAKTHHGFLYT